MPESEPQSSSTEENSPLSYVQDSRRSSGLLSALSPAKISGVYLLAIIIIVFSLWLPQLFPTKSTAISILGSQALAGIVTIGLLFSLAAGAFDLSIGFNITIVSVVEATLLVHHFSNFAAIAIGLLVALVIGLVNGLIVVGLKVNSFIATLATSSVLEGLAIWISNNNTIVGLPQSFIRLGTGLPWGIPVPVIYLAVVSAIGWYLLEHTPFGRHLYAIGFGPEAARLAGVRTGLYTVISLMITALAAGLGGTILAAQFGSASPDVGANYLLSVFAGAFLGATQIKPGRMNVVGALVAMYLLATGSIGLELAGAATWVPYAFNGAALIIAVGAGGVQVRWKVRATARSLRRQVESESASTSSQTAPASDG